VRTQSRDELAFMRFTFDVADLAQLKRAFAIVRELKGVIRVSEPEARSSLSVAGTLGSAAGPARGLWRRPRKCHQQLFLRRAALRPRRGRSRS